MRKLVDDVSDDCDENGENAFFVCDLSRVLSKYNTWKAELGPEKFAKGWTKGVEAFFGELFLFHRYVNP
jgi:hypothetical protein